MNPQRVQVTGDDMVTGVVPEPVEFHYVVFGQRWEDGRFTFGIEEDVSYFPEGPAYDPNTGEWRTVDPDDEESDAAVLREMETRLKVVDV